MFRAGVVPEPTVGRAADVQAALRGSESRNDRFDAERIDIRQLLRSSTVSATAFSAHPSNRSNGDIAQP